MLIKLMSWYTVLMVLLSVISSCSLLEIDEQSEKVDSAGVIQGKVKLATTKRGPVIIHRSYLEGSTFITDTYARATKEGSYSIRALPGTYYLSAFVDSNKDGYFQENEDSAFLGSESGRLEPVIVEDGKTIIVKTISISGKVPQIIESHDDKKNFARILQNIGSVTDLNDPIFVRDNYSIGMWTPFQFLEQIGGGVFFLQAYQQDKIPVLFVHGIDDGPLDWKEVIDRIDQQHFQPWVIYYPSGFRLDMISDYMTKALVRLQDRYNFKQLIIAAYSMGGLVARSAIKKYRQQYPGLSKSISLLVTVNSPLAGMRSASLGVEHSPIVLPVWRDLIPGSKFLTELNTWSWPDDIPYHLVFSYIDGESADSVVSLSSQLPFKVQQETTRMYGFVDSHTGTLKDAIFIGLFNSILADKGDQ